MTRGSSFRFVFFAIIVVVIVVALSPVSCSQKTGKGQHIRIENGKKRAGNSTKMSTNTDDVNDNDVIRVDAKNASRSARQKASRDAVVANAVKPEPANAQQAKNVSSSTPPDAQQKRNKGNVTKRPKSNVSGSGSAERGQSDHKDRKNSMEMEILINLSHAVQKSVSDSLIEICSHDIVQSNWAKISTVNCQRHYKACSTVYQLPFPINANASSLEKLPSAVEEMHCTLSKTRNMVRDQLVKEGCTAEVAANTSKTILHCQQPSNAVTVLTSLYDEISDVILHQTADLIFNLPKEQNPAAIPSCKSKQNRKAQQSQKRQKKKQPRHHHHQLMLCDVTDVQSMTLPKLGLYCMNVMQYAKLQIEAVLTTLQHGHAKGKQTSPTKHVERQP